MKSLSSISTSAFADCAINEFDAPNINSITVDIDDYIKENFTFTIGKKNFLDSFGILQKVDCPNEEPNYEQLIQKLPQECFECDSVDEYNRRLFIVDNAVVFPDNILTVDDRAFDNIQD